MGNIARANRTAMVFGSLGPMILLLTALCFVGIGSAIVHGEEQTKGPFERITALECPWKGEDDQDVYSCLAFSPDGKRLVAGGSRTTRQGSAALTVWDLAHNKVQRRGTYTKEFGYVNALAFATDKVLVTAITDYGEHDEPHASVWVSDLESGEEKQRLSFASAPSGVSSMIACPGQRAVVFAVNFARESAAHCFDLTGCRDTITLAIPDRNILALDLSPDGRLLVTAESCGRIGVYDKDSGRLVREFRTPGNHPTLAVSPVRGQCLLAASAGVVTNGENRDEVFVWNYEDGRRLQTFKNLQSVHVLTFSADGAILAAGGGTSFRFDGTSPIRFEATHPQVLVWEVRTGKQIASLPGHSGDIRDIAFSPEGSLLGSVDSSTACINLWRIRPVHAK